jgi:hypothetical protein
MMEVLMRCKSTVFAGVIVLALMGVPAFAQVQSVDEIETPTPQFQDHGGVTPWFWIGIQTVFSAGYNIETGAGGFRNYGADNHTYATFNLAFVDSHYQTPKFYQVPKDLDPDAWTGHFVLMNFTSRLNSWKGDTEIENNAPGWLAEIAGKGARIGFFSQAADLIGGISDPGHDSDMKQNKPITRISGGNKVLNLKANELGRLFYERSDDSYSTTTYTTSNAVDNGGALMYIGYEKQELFNVFLTMLSEGNVNTEVKKVTVNGKETGRETGKGFAGVIDFGVSPFGVFTDEEKPITFNITGNAIGGFNFNAGNNANESAGFGLKGEGGFWLHKDNLVLSPVVAFDWKMRSVDDPDLKKKMFWKMGGGLTFQFSGMRWASDDWGDLYNRGYNVTGRSFSANGFADNRYENNKILKYAYAQVYGAYSEERDLNLLFRVEEPDGNLGFHEKLGALVEMRLYNLTEEFPPNKKLAANRKESDRNKIDWEAQARVSWDFNINQFLITPYVRAYLNKALVAKFRLGAYANFIPFTGFELAYTSANLNPGVDPKWRPMSFYKSNYDSGRIELIIILKSDDIRPTVPKRMSDWNYPEYIQYY